MRTGLRGPAVRLLILEEQPVFLEGLRMLTQADPGIDVVAVASSASEAFAANAEATPDVLLMDPRTSDGDGLRVLSSLARGEGHAPRVLALSNADSPECVIESLRAGAHGFILKRSSAAQLITAIHCVHAGETPVDSALTRRLLTPLMEVLPTLAHAHAERFEPQVPEPALTQREIQIVQALTRGLGTAEIADELCVERCTVKSHISNILTKWGARDRVQLIHRAHVAGLVRIPTSPAAAQ